MVNFPKIWFIKFNETLKYENADIIHSNINAASVLCKKSPNSIHLVNKYIDKTSSLWVIKGKIVNNVVVVNSKNKPVIKVDINAIF